MITRQILWICDKIGNHGKTALAKYIRTHWKNVKYLKNTKSSDGLYSISDDTKVVVFDFTRSTDPDKINYNIIEEIKDGIFYCPKYESKDMLLKYVPKIVCFANIMPVTGRLSPDRWVIKEIIDKKLIEF